MEYYNVYAITLDTTITGEYPDPELKILRTEICLFVDTGVGGRDDLWTFCSHVVDSHTKPGRYGRYCCNRRPKPKELKFDEREVKLGVTPKQSYPDQWSSLLVDPPNAILWGECGVNNVDSTWHPTLKVPKLLEYADIWEEFQDAMRLLDYAGLLMAKWPSLRAPPPPLTLETMMKAWRKSTLEQCKKKIKANEELKKGQVLWRPDPDIFGYFSTAAESTDPIMCVAQPKFMKRSLTDVLRLSDYLRREHILHLFDASEITIWISEKGTDLRLRKTGPLNDRSAKGKVVPLNFSDMLNVVIRMMRDWYYLRLAWWRLNPCTPNRPILIPSEIMDALEKLPMEPTFEQVWDVVNRIDESESIPSEFSLPKKCEWWRSWSGAHSVDSQDFINFIRMNPWQGTLRVLPDEWGHPSCRVSDEIKSRPE